MILLNTRCLILQQYLYYTSRLYHTQSLSTNLVMVMKVRGKKNRWLSKGRRENSSKLDLLTELTRIVIVSRGEQVYSVKVSVNHNSIAFSFSREYIPSPYPRIISILQSLR
jgi:hypothetical protein